MFSVKSKLVKTDVTSIKIYNDYIFVGIGGDLNIFLRKTLHLIHKISIFEGQKIHGLALSNLENKLLIYSGLHIKTIHFCDDFKDVNNCCYKTADDWILTSKWVDNDSKIATVSMHNKLCIYSTDLVIENIFICEEQCILYSAYICNNFFDNLVILSGTVFSEVLVWWPAKFKDDKFCEVLKRLKQHKGVIFSIDYNEKSGFISSSSDDRSAILWKVKHKDLNKELTNRNIDITLHCQVYGHLARIFKCKILDSFFVTAGEDSLLNIWNYDGSLYRKIETHQGGPVWALDICEDDNIIITGGGDCGVSQFALTNEEKQLELHVPGQDVPKTVALLKNHNVICVTEKGTLYSYISECKEWLKIEEHSNLKSYCIMELSKCRDLVALAGFNGEIYIYKVNNNIEKLCEYTANNKSRIYSFHWLTCRSFLICQTNGLMTLCYIQETQITPISIFLLPPSKERWSTCACGVQKNYILIGDRKGNIHLYVIGQKEPKETIKKVHNYLGITNLIPFKDSVIVLGRTGEIKTFSFKEDSSIQLVSSDKVSFTWLTNVVNDLLLAFSGKNFVIWDFKRRKTLFELNCGGGHRSTDFLKINETFKFVFIKDKSIHISNIRASDIVPKDLVPGFHVKEVNSVKGIETFNSVILISGGEDTTLQVNQIHRNNLNFENICTLKSHLSSIRTVQLHQLSPNNYLIFTGGGRAQIICWKLSYDVQNNVIENIQCSQKYSHYEILDSEDSETRIMDLTVFETSNKTVLLAACSDGSIKVFLVNNTSDNKQITIALYKNIFYKLKCIIKICNFKLFDVNIVVTMATDGFLVFWNSLDLFTDDIKPFYSFKTHQSGINSCSFKFFDNKCAILTGGDDNAIVLNIFNFIMTDNKINIEHLAKFEDVGHHCAQITGVHLDEKYFYTTSIDQRFIIFEWCFNNNILTCKYIKKYNSSIADIQGLLYFKNCAFVYGKGIEYIELNGEV